MATSGITNGNGHAAEPIDHVRAEWIRDFNAKNLSSLMALYSHDAALLPPSGERIAGQDKIAVYFNQLFGAASRVFIKPESDNTDISGDLGFDSGHYEETVKRPGGGSAMTNSSMANSSIGGGGGQTQQTGSYLVVLRRQTGKWLIVQQAFTETAKVPQR